MSRSSLAHILADNTVSAWDPNTNGIVYTLAVSGSTVYAGGIFTLIGGQARNCLAALDATTGLATDWNPNPTFNIFQEDVRALAVRGGTVYVGGYFQQIGGQGRANIAALDSTTGLATSWSPNAAGFGFNTTVDALSVSGSTVYAGGYFTAIGGQGRGYIAALDTTSGLATAWNPNANDVATCLAVSGGTVYAGGIFTSIGGQARNYIAALDSTTGLATAWSPNPNNTVAALSVGGSTVYAGGSFTSIGGQARNYVAALDGTTGLAIAWNPNPNNIVGALSASGSTVYVGGSFTSVGGQARQFLAALDVTTGLATPWNPNANGAVSALAVSGGTVYAGGSFTTVGGQARNRIAALDAATGLTTAWNPNANGDVLALAVSGTTVYAGGSFTTIGGQARNRIAALNAATGLATAWNPNANNLVQVVTVSGTLVYAGGSFTTIGGLARNRIVALDTTTTGLATAWNPNANNPVRAVMVSGTTVYAGGDFTIIGGQTRNRIAALDATTGLATSWDPNANNFLSALVVSGTMVYAGGGFTGIGGQSRNRIAAVDAITALATAWNPSAGNVVNVLVASGPAVYAGGGFTAIGGLPQSYLAAIDAFCPIPGDLADSSATLDSPEVTATGDFDRDGRVDVAAAVMGGAQVMRNLGGGHFQSLTFKSTGGTGRGIAAADFNDDYVLDLAVSTSTGLHVMMGESQGGVPTGSFGPPTTYSVGADPSGIGVADFDEDGIQDLAVAVTGANSVKVLLGDGVGGIAEGSFGVATSYPVGTAPMFLAVSDLNADGIWDLAVTNSGNADVSVLIGQGTNGVGNGGFAPAVSYAVGTSPRPIVTGDFDEDGVTDLAVGSASSNGVSVLRGNGTGGVGDGTFAPAVSYPFSGSVRDLVMADFDGDGRADLGAPLGSDGTLQYLYGDGSSTTGDGRFLMGPAPFIGGYLSTLEVDAFDPLASDPMPIVTRFDRDQLVSLLGGCPGGTARSVELTSPNGGEGWQLGTNVPIQWSRNPLVIAVHVEISRDNGMRWERIASNLTGTEFVWTVAPPGTNQGRIRVADAHEYGLSDASNGTFTMQPLAGVPSSALPVRPSFSLAYPNPSRGAARFDLRLPTEAQVSVEVFDLAGRRVRNLTRGLLPAGEHTLKWDGRTDGGRPAADGVYFVRARLKGFEAVRRVVRIE